MLPLFSVMIFSLKSQFVEDVLTAETKYKAGGVT